MTDVETKGLPYGCDYAKTSRSTCKDTDCKESIGKDELRMSTRTKSSFHDHLQDNWFHFDCFWKRARRGISEASIRNFEHLKWDDQERIRVRIQRKDDDVDDDDKASKNAKAEYAKSAKGTCMGCKEKIPADELRIEFRSGFWHPKCLSEKNLYKKLGEEMDCFEDIEEKDQEELRKLFTGPDENKEKADDEEDSKERLEALKKQTELIWEAREDIISAMDSDKALKAAKNKKALAEKLLEKNGAYVFPKNTVDDHIQFLADIIVFGAFDECPECSRTSFYYSPDRRVYQCAGASKEDRCPYFSREVKRKEFNNSGFKGLAKYNGKQVLPEGRVFSKAVEQGPDEERLIVTTPAPAKKVDLSRKRKLESGGVMKENGFSVDAQFDQAEEFHVLVEDGDPHQFMLHKVKKEFGDLEFYKIQLLKSDDDDEWRLFRRYGIVMGAATPKVQVDTFDEFSKAISKFEKIFHEKTGHKWSERHEDLKPVDGKYQIIEWNSNMTGTYGRSTADTLADENSSEAQPSKKTKKEEESDED